MPQNIDPEKMNRIRSGLGRTPNTIDNIKEVLNKYSIIDPVTNCWLWVGTRNKKGYGHVRFNGRLVGVHRLSMHLHFGFDLSEQLNYIQVLHQLNCPNKNCWNPNHLYYGSHQDNMDDKVAIGHAINPKDGNKTHCIHGHEFNEENTYIDKKRNKRVCRTCVRNRKGYF